MDPAKIHEENERAWDIVAGVKYARDVDRDVAFLAAGGTSLMHHELRLLADLRSWCGRAIHLQCSHGLDALSLWKLGAHEVVGLDISASMLVLAERKAQLLGAPATWIHSNVLDAPHTLNGTADLVYTGKGALPWVTDLQCWAAVIERLLKPGGLVFVFEGHPLNWVWEPGASEFRLRADGGDYFAAEPRANRDFPASGLKQAVASGRGAHRATEQQWTLGEIVTSLAGVGLTLERLEEHPEQYWPLFRGIPEAVVKRLPHTFSLRMRKAQPITKQGFRFA
ncbi:MAG: class I SAM-dependent methyltransferase [Phycisphaerales bacterium]|nr:class I SAM-dependent methyltransferase [Phycisphaerales bacterium]